MNSLAADGGLFVPAQPIQTDAAIAKPTQDYISVAQQVVSFFADDSLPLDIIQSLLTKSYNNFRHKALTPLRQLSYNQWYMPMYYGPTLSFKDYALQFLSNLCEHFLQQSQQQQLFLAATSGDTGAAAVSALAGKKNIKLIVFHPHQRITPFQRQQMTTCHADNVLNIALNGSFDDCQNVVKFFLRKWHDKQDNISVSSINSINWVRIVLQVVYYVYASSRLAHDGQGVVFSVPSGNFGNVYAAFLAKQMGAPIKRLIIATNANNVLHRLLHSGSLSIQKVQPTLSPSMDIQVPSNFERLLFYLAHHSTQTNVVPHQRVTDFMLDLTQKQHAQLSQSELQTFQQTFNSKYFDDTQTLNIIKQCYQQYDEIVDPHSALAIEAAKLDCKSDEVVISVGTAHYSKFQQAITKALHNTLPHPNYINMNQTNSLTENFIVRDNKIHIIEDEIKNFCQIK